jgi:hypothetical protein
MKGNYVFRLSVLQVAYTTLESFMPRPENNCIAKELRSSEGCLYCGVMNRTGS